MEAIKKRYIYLFTSTRGLALVGIAAVSLVTAIWGTLSGPMVEWGVRDITVRLLGLDLVQAEREGRIIMLYHTIAMSVVAIEVYFITAIVRMKNHERVMINATITMTGFGWGTRIDMACTYADWGQRDAPPQQLGMVVIDRDGSRAEVATWLGVSGATALPSANTPMQLDEIAAVQLVSADSGEVLLERQL